MWMWPATRLLFRVILINRKNRRFRSASAALSLLPAVSWILKMCSAPPTPVRLSPPATEQSLSPIRLLVTSRNIVLPASIGASPAPADLAITLNEDANIQVGIHHSRAGLFRLAWHPTKEFAWAFEVQNPQQFTNNEVVFPAAFNAGAIFTTAKIANQISPSTAASPFVTHSKIGGGGMAAMNIEPVKNVRFLVNGMYGSGIGRYSIALGPNAVVRPVALTATTFDADISMVHSGSGSGGIEIQATPNTQIAGYYGGAYFQRNAFPDITAAGATKPIIGFGGATSANTNNRAIQEGTVDFIQTWWK